MSPAPSPRPGAAELKTLLRKYIAHVRGCEGVDFLEHQINDGVGSDVIFSAEEIGILMASRAPAVVRYEDPETPPLDMSPGAEVPRELLENFAATGSVMPPGKAVEVRTLQYCIDRGYLDPAKLEVMQFLFPTKEGPPITDEQGQEWRTLLPNDAVTIVMRRLP